MFFEHLRGGSSSPEVKSSSCTAGGRYATPDPDSQREREEQLLDRKGAMDHFNTGNLEELCLN